MTPERISSILINGEVNERDSKKSHPIELAVEGKFKVLSYTKFNPIEEVVHRNAAMRVVIREGTSKHIVVTLYPLSQQDIEKKELPEVPNNVW